MRGFTAVVLPCIQNVSHCLTDWPQLIKSWIVLSTADSLILVEHSRHIKEFYGLNYDKGLSLNAYVPEYIQTILTDSFYCDSYIYSV